MTRPLAPCGTPAAAHRHYRHNEPIDEACLQAWRDEANRRWTPLDERPTGGPDICPIRNGIPWTPYTYRAPRPAWALRALRRAEAEHGTPPETGLLATLRALE